MKDYDKENMIEQKDMEDSRKDEEIDLEDVRERIGNELKAIGRKRVSVGIVALLAIVLIVFGTVIALKIKGSGPKEAEIITKTSLEKIIEISELSTFTSTYNGVAVVMNEKKPDKVDYYVAYEAKINAGIDLDAVEIELDKSSMTINVKLPDVQIFEPEVDIQSLDYIFYNDKANQSSVSAQAFKACNEDVTRESNEQLTIRNLAMQNAKNSVEALLRPIVERAGGEYTLNVE